MRRDYAKFQDREAEVLVVVHDTVENGRHYYAKFGAPFPGLVDEDHAVYDLYDVASKALSLGQRPGLFIVDKGGIVRFAYVGSQQWQIPPNSRVLAQLDALRDEDDVENGQSSGPHGKKRNRRPAGRNLGSG